MATVLLRLGPPTPKWRFGPPVTTLGQQGDRLKQSAVATAYVQNSVEATVGGAIYNPTSDAVSYAFVPVGDEPGASDWKTGSWTTALTTGTYLAQCLVGPGVGAAVALAQGSYAVWVKIVTSGSEIAAHPTGVITIF